MIELLISNAIFILAYTALYVFTLRHNIKREKQYQEIIIEISKIRKGRTDLAIKEEQE